MKLKIKFRKKPKVYTVSKVWDEKGILYWEMSAKDFDKLFANQNVVKINGKICGNTIFGENSVIVHRGR